VNRWPHRDPRAAQSRHRREPHGGVVDWQTSNVYEIFAQWRHRYAPGTTHNTAHVFGLQVPREVPVNLNPREHLVYAWLPWEEAAARCFSWSNRAAIEALPARVARQGAFHEPH
jgi:dATP pyrophosphohydrolase